MKKISLSLLVLVCACFSTFAQLNTINSTATGAGSSTDVFTHNGYSMPEYSLGWYYDQGPNVTPTIPPYAYFSAYGGFKFFTAAQVRMMIDMNGNVGIGTASPGAKLDIHGAGANLLLGVDSYIRSSPSSNDNGAAFPLQIGPAKDTQTPRYLQLGQWADANTFEAKMVLNANSGYVGIGTTTPSANLHVVGTLLTNGNSSNLDGRNLSFLSNSGHMLMGWNRTRGGGEADFISNQSAGGEGGFAFYNYDNSGNESQLMWVKGNGSVGIGTASPVLKLHVDGTSGFPASSGSNQTGVLRLGLTSGGNSVLDFGSSGALGQGWIQSTDRTNLALNYALLLNPNGGGVGINTTYIPTGYQLAVNGTAIFTQAYVQLRGTWPDYVFKKDYSLRPLSEIKSYIEQNQHLPDMPAASTVEKDGINLGEMNKALLKKVEELTLYLIEKDKQINGQQRELNVQKENNLSQKESIQQLELRLKKIEALINK